MGPAKSQNGRQQTHVGCPPVAERENCYSLLSCFPVGPTEFVKLRAQRPPRVRAGWGWPTRKTRWWLLSSSHRPLVEMRAKGSQT